MTRETIAKIVKASGVSAGELILIHFWGENADKTVADQFAAAVAALGASPVVLQQARSVNREIFAGAKESCFDERYFGLFSKFDAVLDVFACQPIVLGYELEDAQMDLYRRYISQLFEKLVTCRRFAQIRIPTAANAAESGLDPQEYIRRMDRADEAAFEKIRANVYDIFRTVLSVAEKTCGDEEDAVRDFFARRAQTIPAGWAAAYEKAKEHHDPVRLQIEKLKLDTVGEVRTQFKKIWEGAE